MTTGYTAFIEEGMDPKIWLQQIVVRAFGICIMLRDEPLGLTTEEVLQQLAAATESPFHTEAVGRAERELATRQPWTQVEWEREAESLYKAALASYHKNLAEVQAKREQYAAARAAVETLEAKLSGVAPAILVNILKFAREQIDDSTRYALDPPEPPVSKPWADLREQSLAALARDLDYSGEMLEKEKSRQAERLANYKAWIEFVGEGLP